MSREVRNFTPKPVSEVWRKAGFTDKVIQTQVNRAWGHHVVRPLTLESLLSYTEPISQRMLTDSESITLFDIYMPQTPSIRSQSA